MNYKIRPFIVASLVIILATPPVFASGGQQATSGAAQSAATGVGAAVGMGAAQTATGTALCSNYVTMAAGIILIAMGMLSFGQGGEDSASSGANYDNADRMAQTQGRNVPGNNNVGGITPAQTQELAKVGVTVDPKGKTITTKDGKVIPFAAFATKSGAMAAGFSASDVDKAWSETEKIAAKVAADLKSGKNGFGVDGGVAGGRGGGDAGVTYQDASALRMPTSKIDEKGAGLAGMKKNYNGDPIGVAADDIFVMMNRRYDSEVKQSKFFGLRETVVP